MRARSVSIMSYRHRTLEVPFKKEMAQTLVAFQKKHSVEKSALLHLWRETIPISHGMQIAHWSTA